ncbi:MAG: SurA N-terminal domain-containing protein [PVC group bacterium]
MLKGMRRSAKQILWPLIIALVITMGGYGVWYLVRPEVATSQAGVIWGEKITLEEFIQTARTAQAVAAFSGQELNQNQLYTLAWRRLLSQKEAEKMGVTTTRKELVFFLARWPAFQVRGKFDPRRYRQALDSLGMEAGAFEDQVQKLLAIDKMGLIIQSQALVSEDEIAQTYQRLNEKIRVEYVQIAQEQFSVQTGIADLELAEFYRQNTSRFQVQTQVEIRYILIPWKKFAGEVSVTPEEIEARYRESSVSFAGETGKAPKLSDVEDALREELVREKAEKGAAAMADAVNRRLDDANSLERPAEEFSLSIRESGPFGADEPVPGLGDLPEINRLALTMEIDEVVSYPVPGPEGFIFFQVTGKKDASILPFEEAREEIIKIIGEERARQEAMNATRNALTEVRRLMTDEEYDFESAVTELGLKTVTTPFFSREGSEDIPASPLFVQASFLTVPGRASEIVPTEEGFVFLTVSGREPAGPMPKDEKERWEAATRKYKAALVYDTWFNNLIQESKFSITNKDLAP